MSDYVHVLDTEAGHEEHDCFEHQHPRGWKHWHETTTDEVPV